MEKVEKKQEDPTETTLINVEALPPLTSELKQIIEKLKHSTSRWTLKQNINKLAQQLKAEFQIQEMVAKVEDTQLNNLLIFDANRPNLKYKLSLYPKFQRLAINYHLNAKSLSLGPRINLFSNNLKKIELEGTSKFWASQLAIKMSVLTPYLCKATTEFKYGKPLDDRWVADCRKLNLAKIIQSKHQNYKTNQEFYLQIKGYHNRLARLEKQRPGIYIDKSRLKVIDVVETGCKVQRKLSNMMLSYSMSAALGMSYQNRTAYVKLKAGGTYGLLMWPQSVMILEGKLCHTEGKNLIPHQMFSRNYRKWMGERSQSILNIKSKIIATKGLLPHFNIYPYNYVSFWVSRNLQKQIKLESELGLGLMIDAFYLDVPLLQMSGQLGKPRLGFKFQF